MSDAVNKTVVAVCALGWFAGFATFLWAAHETRGWYTVAALGVAAFCAVKGARCAALWDQQ